MYFETRLVSQWIWILKSHATSWGNGSPGRSYLACQRGFAQWTKAVTTAETESPTLAPPLGSPLLYYRQRHKGFILTCQPGYFVINLVLSLSSWVIPFVWGFGWLWAVSNEYEDLQTEHCSQSLAEKHASRIWTSWKSLDWPIYLFRVLFCAVTWSIALMRFLAGHNYHFRLPV